MKKQDLIKNIDNLGNELGEHYTNIDNNIYHYTDINGLMGIISTSQFWLTKRDFLNDIYDKSYAEDLYTSILENETDRKKLISDYTHESNLYTDDFIFSLSLEGDLSNQWSHYGNKDGYCLVFDTIKIFDFFVNYPDKKEIGLDITPGKVIYDYKIQNNIMRKHIKIVDQMHELDLVDELDSDVFILYQEIISNTKHINNAAEKEVRFSIGTKRKHKDKIDYVQKDGIITPIIKFPIKLHKESKKSLLPIKEIIIGPGIHDKMAINGLKQFLDSHGYSDVDISLSKSKTRR